MRRLRIGTAHAIMRVATVLSRAAAIVANIAGRVMPPPITKLYGEQVYEVAMRMRRRAREAEIDKQSSCAMGFDPLYRCQRCGSLLQQELGGLRCTSCGQYFSSTRN